MLLHILPPKCIILIIFYIRLEGEIDFKISFPNQNIGYILVSVFSNIITEFDSKPQQVKEQNLDKACNILK